MASQVTGLSIPHASQGPSSKLAARRDRHGQLEKEQPAAARLSAPAASPGSRAPLLLPAHRSCPPGPVGVSVTQAGHRAVALTPSATSQWVKRHPTRRPDRGAAEGGDSVPRRGRCRGGCCGARPSPTAAGGRRARDRAERAALAAPSRANGRVARPALPAHRPPALGAALPLAALPRGSALAQAASARPRPGTALASAAAAGAGSRRSAAGRSGAQRGRSPPPHKPAGHKPLRGPLRPGAPRLARPSPGCRPEPVLRERNAAVSLLCLEGAEKVKGRRPGESRKTPEGS